MDIAHFETRFIPFQGGQIAYLDEGSGPPLLLMHGGGPASSGSSHYTANIAELAQRFRVIAIDLPGHGQSSTLPMDEPTYVFYAKAARHLLESLSLRSAHVIGYSMGGGAALSLAALHPASVDRLVVIGGGGNALPNLFAARPLEGQRAMGSYARQPTRENFDTVQRLFVHDQTVIDESLLAALWEREQVRRAAHPAAAASTPLPDDLISRLARIKAETLIVRGRDDVYAPLDQGLLSLSLIPNSRLHVFSNCGHWVQFERANEFNPLATLFLES